jgi:hypothetical protein
MVYISIVTSRTSRDRRKVPEYYSGRNPKLVFGYEFMDYIRVGRDSPRTGP